MAQSGGGWGTAPGGAWGPPGMGAPPPPAPPPRPSSGGKIAILVAAVLGGVVVLGMIAGVAIYSFRRYVERAQQAPQGAGGVATGSLPPKISSAAHTHVPSGCELLIRLDFERALLAPAFQKHVVPALDDLERNASSDPTVKELLSRAGIEPKSDIDEAILCFVGLERPEPEQKFALILGGQLRPETIVPAVEAVEKPKPETSTFDGRKVATGRDRTGGPVIVGQAGDGAIVFASDRVLFESAIRGGMNFSTEYGLPVDVEASAIVTRAFIQDAMKSSGGAANPLSRDLGAMNKAVGTITLANPKAVIRMSMASPRAAVSFNQVLATAVLPGFKQQASRGQSQVGEFEALVNAKSRVDGSDVVVEMPWTAQGVEQAAQKLADQIRRLASKGVPL